MFELLSYISASVKKNKKIATIIAFNLSEAAFFYTRQLKSQ